MCPNGDHFRRDPRVPEKSNAEREIEEAQALSVMKTMRHKRGDGVFVQNDQGEAVPAVITYAGVRPGAIGTLLPSYTAKDEEGNEYRQLGEYDMMTPEQYKAYCGRKAKDREQNQAEVRSAHSGTPSGPRPGLMDPEF